MRRLAGVAALVMALLATPGEAAVNFRALASDRPPETLSATGLFADLHGHRLAAAVEPYQVAAELWSDGAHKARAVALPPGATAKMAGDGLIDLPVGAVLVKSFFAPATAAGPARALETRLLVRRESGWVALPYVWDARGRDARLMRAGARLPVAMADADGAVRPLSWQVPNVNQCKTCHSLAGEMKPIGFKARNLAATGDLERLASLGLISAAGPVAAPVPLLADSKATLEARARAYLDANCGHCHQRRGSASNSGLYLNWEEGDRVALGIGKRPVAAGRGSGGHSFAIDPGHPDRSILLFRMESAEPGVMMPELGRAIPDAVGIALVRAWIGSLKL